jgi:hypothetical protein
VSDGVTFGWLPVAQFLEEPNVWELMEQEYDEFEKYRRQIPMAVDFDRMLEAERQFRYRMWAAHKDGLLIGFIEFHLGPTFHNRSMLYAQDGGHFLSPEFRDVFTFLKMWRTAEEALEELGVEAILGHDNVMRPVPAVFKRLGYEPVGTVYLKVLT